MFRDVSTGDGNAAEISVVLYDGVCGLCNALIRFVIQRDRHNVFRFASLQSRFAARLLREFGADSSAMANVYVISDYGRPTQQLWVKSDAILYILPRLGTPWPVTRFLRIVPRRIRDTAYDIVAANRYRLGRRHMCCLVPTTAEREKFIDT